MSQLARTHCFRSSSPILDVDAGVMGRFFVNLRHATYLQNVKHAIGFREIPRGKRYVVAYYTSHGTALYAFEQD